jgi:hypothetical protein
MNVDCVRSMSMTACNRRDNCRHRSNLKVKIFIFYKIKTVLRSDLTNNSEQLTAVRPTTPNPFSCLYQCFTN